MKRKSRELSSILTPEFFRGITPREDSVSFHMIFTSMYVQAWQELPPAREFSVLVTTDPVKKAPSTRMNVVERGFLLIIN
ncbi:hypothetical protein [Tumebacillus flagellatus]|uniref:Uncharacterized protein n=1 Tax=Tumebacillus flagellatus TaxID=1157490 RepID=A0A074LRB6_9BACL|nr:hypothetical protein [Tumebacillus flagellatus]KEO84656.1 hypothetical protein EL26_03825 [Tumebacillus flagellatus]